MEKDKNGVKTEMSAQSDLGSNTQNISEPVSFPACSARAGHRSDKEALAQLGALKQEFEQVKQVPQQLRQRVMDSEYWCTICFQTQEQLMFFFNALAMSPYENKYVDGQLLAQKLGITLPPAEVRFRLFKHIDKDFQKLVDN